MYPCNRLFPISQTLPQATTFPNDFTGLPPELRTFIIRTKLHETFVTDASGVIRTEVLSQHPVLVEKMFIISQCAMNHSQLHLNICHTRVHFDKFCSIINPTEDIRVELKPSERSSSYRSRVWNGKRL